MRKRVSIKTINKNKTRKTLLNVFMLTFIMFVIGMSAVYALSYTVSYNNNGGSGTMSNSTFTSNPGTLSTNTFTKSGYKFMGWNKNSSGTSDWYRETNSITGTDGSSTTLYAQWCPNSEATLKISNTEVKDSYGNYVFRNNKYITVKADNKTITYGGTPSYSYTVTGTLNGETGVTGSASYTVKDSSNNTVTPSSAAVGTYTISVSGLSAASGYNIQTTNTGTLTINKKTCPAPTNVAVSTAGRVTWTASSDSNCNKYKINLGTGSYTNNVSSGIDYLSTINAATGSRTVNVIAYSDDTTNYNESSAASKAVTVYAITLASNDTNKGTVSPTSVNVISGATVETSSNNLLIKGVTTGSTTTTLATITPSPKSGYSFSSWSKTSGSLTSSQTITGTFIANTYTITYYQGNATSTAGVTQLGTSTCTYGTTCTLATYAGSSLNGVFPYSTADHNANSSHTDYSWVFAGWSASQTGTARDYTDGQSFTYNSTANMSLYAVGKKTYYFYGGANSTLLSSPIQYWNPYSTSTTYMTSIAFPAKTDISTWTFCGFKAGDSTAGASQCNSPTYAASTAGTTQTPAYNNYPYTRSVYSRTLTVSYNANGGSGTTANTTLVQYFNTGYSTANAQLSSNSITLANNGFSKTGYTFSKWTDGSTSGTEYSQGAAYTGVGATVSDTKVSTTMYAKWSANTYTVTLDKGTGTTAGTTSVTATYNSATISPSTITLASKSYTISGFGIAASRNSDGASVSSTSTLTSTATLNGYYSSSTKVLDANTTATWTASASGFTDANKKWTKAGTATLTANFGSMPSKTLPTITKTGYTCGWTTSSTGTTITYASGGSLAPTANTTLYGVCTINSYTLTINPNGGTYNSTTSNTTVTQNYGTTYSFVNNPTRAGYIFNGWTHSGSGTYNRYDTSSTVSNTATFNYNASTSTLPTAYNNSGGGTVTNAMVSDSTATGGYSLKVTTNGAASPGAGGIYVGSAYQTTPGRINVVEVKAKIPSGYNLYLGGISYQYTGISSAWETDAYAGTGAWKTYYLVVYTGDTGTFSGTMFLYIQGSNNTSVTWNINSIVVRSFTKANFKSKYTFGAGAGTLTAKWTIGGSRITFNNNGGAFNTTYVKNWTNGYNNVATASADRNYTYNTAYNTYPGDTDYNWTPDTRVVSRTGYTFAGWYTAASGGTKVFNANGTLVSSVSGYSDSSGKWIKYDANVTLYAHWTGNPYTVTYEDNLFTGTSETQNGVTRTVDVANSYLTLNGTWSATSFNLWNYERRTINANDVYRITMTYVSGSYTTTVNPVFVLDLTTNGTTFSDRGTSPLSYKTLTFPTSGTSTTTFTVDSSRASANGLYFWAWHSTASATTFTNYKVRILVSKVHTKSVTMGSTYGTLDTPTKSGYAFAGWYTAVNGSTQVSSSTTVSTASNHTIYAKWTAYTMTLKYHVNGGTIASGYNNSNGYWRVGSDSLVERSTDSGSTWADITGTLNSTTVTADLWNVATYGATRTGWYITGTEAYNTKADGTGYNINQDHNLTTSTTNAPTAIRLNGGAALTSNVTQNIYVKWKGNTYTATFYYQSSATNGTQTIASATASCTVSSGSSCSATIPSAVRSSVGKYNNAYAGLSTSTGNMTQAVASGTTTVTLSANATYYSIYRSSVTNYYYSSSYTSRTIYRNQWFTSTSAMATPVLSTATTGTTATSNYSTATGPGSSVWYGLSTGQDTTREYSSVSAAAQSNSATLYTVYQFNVTYTKGVNVSSIGATSGSCLVTTSSTSCNVTLPTITANSGATSLGWYTSSGTYQGTAAGSSYSINANPKTLYANAGKNYTVTITVKNGTLSGSATRSITEGKSITVTVTPNSNFAAAKTYSDGASRQINRVMYNGEACKDTNDNSNGHYVANNDAGTSFNIVDVSANVTCEITLIRIGGFTKQTLTDTTENYYGILLNPPDYLCCGSSYSTDTTQGTMQVTGTSYVFGSKSIYNKYCIGTSITSGNSCTARYAEGGWFNYEPPSSYTGTLTTDVGVFYPKSCSTVNSSNSSLCSTYKGNEYYF